MSDKAHELYTSHTNQMEKSLVSAAIIGPDYMDSVLEIVKVDDFSDQVFAKLWGVLVYLKDAGRPFAPQIIMGEVKKLGFYDQFNRADYGRLIQDNASPLHMEYYAEEVARLAAQRRIMWAANVLLQSQYEVDFDPAKAFAQFEAKAHDLAVGPSDGVWLAKTTETVIAKHKSTAHSDEGMAISTGYRDFDEIVGGYYQGHLMMIAARTFMGKTTLALNLMAKLLIQKKSCLFFSLEMTADDLTERVLSFVSGTPYSHFNRSFITPDKADELARFVDVFGDWKAKIYEKPRQTVRSIRAICKMHKAIHGLDVVFIDNLQLIAPSDSRLQRNERLMDNSAKLKEVAKELGIAIVLLNQLNAAADGVEPNDTHLAGSKEVITDVDEMVYLHRPTKISREAVLIVTKTRKGLEGRARLQFDGAIQLFSDAPQEDLPQ